MKEYLVTVRLADGTMHSAIIWAVNSSCAYHKVAYELAVDTDYIAPVERVITYADYQRMKQAEGVAA